ncbi:MAG: DUF1439 domain-containing protein [Myxococcaceae bacterium]|jgi:hypothetical protein|nr:DUF1439 domain-containing protein [Myxococcaceae bacterium]
MTRPHPFALIAPLVTCALALGGCAAPGRLNVALGAEQLERELSKGFPVKREASVLFLELADPKVRLEAGSDKVGLTLRASLGIAVLRLEGLLTVRGRVRYQSEQGVFFLDAPEVVSLEVPGLPAAKQEQVFGLVTDVTQLFLPTVPIYRVPQRSSARLLLKAVRVEQGRLIAELGL